jgi:hypothetical protein
VRERLRKLEAHVVLALTRRVKSFAPVRANDREHGAARGKLAA